MTIQGIDSKTLKNMILAGAKYLDLNKKYLNELNVFPVPDGDTGTNMSLTILSATKELMKANDSSMQEITKALSSGSLRGARGNSGVILSQLFRGFSKELALHEVVDTVSFANALLKGVDTAYKAVMKPKEGTILTVAREAAEKAASVAMETDDLLYLLRETIKQGEDTLARTPDMLPVLKQAGVVDAGGQGWVYVLKGAYLLLENGEDSELILEADQSDVEDVKLELPESSDDIQFGYCTEFIINVTNKLEIEKETQGIQMFLETIGDSIVAVSDEDIIKIHVHTNDPGKALQKGLSAGALVNIKIDNMREQHSHVIMTDNSKPVEPVEIKEVGFVVISIGEGIGKIFKSLGADFIIEGGQTMNPSTEDVLNAIEKVHAKNVFILPNNKNIILAANQAKELVKDKNVIVIPTKSIPQGITAMISYDQGASIDENNENLDDAINDVVTGQVTYAIRDTSYGDKDIAEGDIIGIGNGDILAVEKDIDSCAKELAKHLVTQESELVTIYYGEDTDEEAAKEIAEFIKTINEECDIEVHYGGQPLYYYIFSVE